MLLYKEKLYKEKLYKEKLYKEKLYKEKLYKEKVNTMQPWYKKIVTLFAAKTDASGAGDPKTAPESEQPGIPAKDLVTAALNTLPDEIGCDECFQEVDRFVELQLAGLDAAQAMPLVQAHLDRCPDCREEYEALLCAMEASE